MFFILLRAVPQAGAVVVTGISTSASVDPRYSVSVKAKSTEGAKPELIWTGYTSGEGWRASSDYLELDIDCNYLSWRADIYTDNSSYAGGYLKNGLINCEFSHERIPLAWIVSCSTIAVSVSGEPGELVTNEVCGTVSSGEVPWTYMKDRNDADDPDTSTDESWDHAFNTGSTVVIFREGKNIMLPYGMNGSLPLKIYLEGFFGPVSGGRDYSTVIFIDIVFE